MKSTCEQVIDRGYGKYTQTINWAVVKKLQYSNFKEISAEEAEKWVEYANPESYLLKKFEMSGCVNPQKKSTIVFLQSDRDGWKLKETWWKRTHHGETQGIRWWEPSINDEGSPIGGIWRNIISYLVDHEIDLVTFSEFLQSDEIEDLGEEFSE